MKKAASVILFTIGIVFLYFTGSVYASVDLVFGPTLVEKSAKIKGEIQETYLSVPIEDDTKEYILSIRERQLRSKVKVILNGVEVVTTRTAFVNGMIEKTVTLNQGNNELRLAVYKGEIDVAIYTTTPITATRALHCAVIGTDGMLVGEGVNVAIQILGVTNEHLSGVTGIDGFCAFTELPSEGTVLISVSGNGVEGGEVASLKSKNDNITSIIYLHAQGIGKVSGRTDANAVVQIIFKASKDYPIPNVLYKKAVISDTSGFYTIDNLPLGRFRIQVNASSAIIMVTMGEVTSNELDEIKTGSEAGELTDVIPEEEVDVETTSPCPINSELRNGDFSLGTLGWATEGLAGTMWQPYLFEEKEEDPCDPSLDPISKELRCGAIAVRPDYPYSSISQTFTVPEGVSTLECRIRYRNEAYRSSVSVTDPFSVRVETRNGTTILAEGDVSTYPEGNPPPEDISFGLIPTSAEIPLRFDIAAMEGEVIKIIAEIRHENIRFEGTLGISDVKVIEEGRLLFHSSHSLVLPSTLSFRAGMVVKLVFKNTNPILGSAIVVVQSPDGQTKTLAILASSNKSVTFDVWGCEPMGWAFNVRSLSAINQFIFCDVYSTWIEGMPENQ